MDLQKLEEFQVIKGSYQFSQNKLAELRKKLAEAFDRTDICIVTTGSFGRCEASSQSDLDYFIICEDGKCDQIKTLSGQIENKLLEIVPHRTGATGTFGKDAIESISSLLNNIGGDLDENKKFTKRILFLLEGAWLFNEEKFNTYRAQLLEKYIKEGVPDHHLSKFFLNDIIRYYRTIATDYEFKITENGKDWGLRNVKLRFSRKLLYFSGIIVVAETGNMTRQDKLDKTHQLLEKPALERVLYLSDVFPKAIFERYEEFLSQISNENVRNKLESVDRNNRDACGEFVKLRNAGQQFSWALSKWLRDKYDVNHPIHHSLLF